MAQVADAGRSEEEIAASEGSERPFPRIGQELRLNHRWVDVRAPASQSIFRVRGAVCALFREALTSRGFTEIHTPKLIGGESEGGAGVAPALTRTRTRTRTLNPKPQP